MRKGRRRRIKRFIAVSKARHNRAIETWASISLSLLLVGAAGLLLLTPNFFWGGVLVLIVTFMLIEAELRGAFTQTLSRITTVLGLISVFLLLIHFWLVVIALSMLGAAIYLSIQHLRELNWRNIAFKK
jgi:hypothetical protein